MPGQGGERRDPPWPQGQALVVLLARPGRGAPESLMKGLKKRGLATRVVTDAPQAMLAMAAPQARGLVVVEPAEHPRREELLTAVRRYHPRAMLWAYRTDRAGRSSLSSLDHHVSPRCEGAGSNGHRRDPGNGQGSGHAPAASPAARHEPEARASAPSIPPQAAELAGGSANPSSKTSENRAWNEPARGYDESVDDLDTSTFLTPDELATLLGSSGAAEESDPLDDAADTEPSGPGNESTHDPEHRRSGRSW